MPNAQPDASVTYAPTPGHNAQPDASITYAPTPGPTTRPILRKNTTGPPKKNLGKNTTGPPKKL